MRFALCTASLAALIGIGSASAADTTINDVRFGIGFGIAEDGTFDLGPQEFDVDQSSLRFSIGHVRSHGALDANGAFIYGGNLFYEQGGGDIEDFSGDAELNTTAFGFDLEGGYAYAFSGLPALHLEGALFLGYFHQTNSVGQPGGDTDLGGPGFEYGLRVSGLYTFDNHWQAALNLRYLIDSTSSGDFTTEEVEYSVDGLSLGLGIGYRL